MSRIGKLPVHIPAGVTVTVDGNLVTLKGPKGTLSQEIVDRKISIKVDGNVIHVECADQTDKETNSKYGLYRQLINNMVNGVVTPFTKTLVVNGVGWKVAMNGSKLTMSLGLSHPVEMTAPQGITVTCPDANTIVVTGIDKALVGQFAATVKSKRPVEPYHAYGIRYSDEVVILKEGKKGK